MRASTPPSHSEVAPFRSCVGAFGVRHVTSEEKIVLSAPHVFPWEVSSLGFVWFRMNSSKEFSKTNPKRASQERFPK